MREPLPDSSFSVSYFFEKLNSHHLARRQFLKTAVIAGAGIALCPSSAFADSSDAELWKNRVTGFAYSICDDRAAGRIESAISRARVVYASTPDSFHMSYAAPLVIVGTTIEPQNAGCSNCFEIDRFPFYDINTPCLRIKDMNAFEIRRVTNGKEVNQFGCVLAPCNEREPVRQADMADFRRTAEDYGYDPSTIRADYKRPFNNHKGRVVRGYGVTTRRSESWSKPERDMLLSTQDV